MAGQASEQDHSEQSCAVSPEPGAREPPDPWLERAGAFCDDPTWDEFQAAIAEYRRKADARERGLPDADGNIDPEVHLLVGVDAPLAPEAERQRVREIVVDRRDGA